MNARLQLRLIRSNLAEKIAPKRERMVEGPNWPNNLPPPVFASDTRNKEIAVSALCNLVMRDGERLHSCDLTAEQASDIANWIMGKK